MSAGASSKAGNRFQSGIEPRPSITVRVGRPEVAPAATLAAAEKVAGHILARAGVEVRWLECRGFDEERHENPCLRDLGTSEFWVHLLPRKPPNFSGDVAG